MATEQRYSVKTRFIFEGCFFIHASYKAQAREYAENHCGLVLGGSVHSTLPDDIVDWDFPVHPVKSTGTVTLIKFDKHKETL